MKIAFICPSISRALGGIFEVERKLAQSLTRIPETSVDVLGVEDEHTRADLPEWLPLQPQYFPVSQPPASFRYSSGLERAVLSSTADLLHMHALWTHNSVIVNKWAHRTKRPYLITPNGMLDPWAVRNSGWKKKIALALFERQCLQNAACIQVFSQGEYESVRQFGLKNPICIIPNGVGLPPALEQSSPPWEVPPNRKVLLYLGRLHPKKGLINLLNAWNQLNPSSWTLAIAGWDQAGHEAELKKLALQDSVIFLGPRFGNDKTACYHHCDAFILPSFSEGLPIVVLEAWSHAKPVLMTPECNLPSGFQSNAALCIQANVDSIAAGLQKLMAMSNSDLEAMGQNGLALAQNQFTWPKIATDLRSVYAWMLNAGPKPSCVVD